MVKVKQIMKKFEMKALNPEHADYEKEVLAPSIHRMGLELTGAAPASNMGNVIGWGTRESKYLLSLSKEEAIKNLDRVITDTTPAIILSKGVSKEVVDLIIPEANKHKTAVFQRDMHLATINMNIGWYIIKHFAPKESVHGSLVVMNGLGVMIVGESGIGKSEAVLELIQRGHLFVSDDTVFIKKIGTEFFGEPSPITKGYLEARGMGLIDVPSVYGLKSVKDKTIINLVIELVGEKDLNNVDRLGTDDLSYEILGGKIKKMQLPLKTGRSLSSLIEAATNLFTTRVNGVADPLDEIMRRRDESN